MKKAEKKDKSSEGKEKDSLAEPDFEELDQSGCFSSWEISRGFLSPIEDFSLPPDNKAALT